MNSKTAFVYTLSVLNLLAPHNADADGVWYAQVKGDKVEQCLNWTDLDLDGAHKFLENTFKTKCTLDGSKRIFYVFHCGQNNNQLLTRTKEGCLFVQDLIAGLRKAPDLYAPASINNKNQRERWIVGFNSCFEKAYISMGIEKAEPY